MPKSAYRATPVVISGYLYTEDDYTGTAVNTLTWFVWLSLGRTFYYETQIGCLTARCEQRRHCSFWYAFRRIKGKLRKVYLGKSVQLTQEVLDKAIARLAMEPSFADR